MCMWLIKGGGYVEGCIGKIVRTFFLSALTGRVAPIIPKKQVQIFTYVLVQNVAIDLR